MKHKYLLLLALCAFSTPAFSQIDVLDVARNDIKATLLSLGSGSTRITYERAFSPRNSAEITLGIIGWGWDWMNKTASDGLLVKAAHKWNLRPARKADSWLCGLYVKPEFVAALFDYASSDGSAPAQRTEHYALLAEGGYQLVARWFVFDIYTGLGPAFGTGNDNNYFHSFMCCPAGSHLAFTAGFRIGVAF